MYNLDNYSLVQLCRPKKSGGGVALYVKNGLNYLIRNDLSFSSPEIEILFIEIKGSTAKPKLIGCVYRPPNTDVSQFNDRIKSCLNILDSEKKDIHLMGDFNVNLLNHHSHNKTNEFIETMFSYGLYPLISKPTRISTRSCTLIDNIFLNDFYENVETGLLYTDISDHFPIFCLIKTDRKGEQQRSVGKCNVKRRLITKHKIQEFKVRLSQVDWSGIYISNDANTSYNNFIDLFMSVYNDCFPLVNQRSKNNCKKPWITNGLLTSIKKKNKMYIAYIRKPCEKSRLKYTVFKNKLTSLLRNSKKLYFSEIFQKCKGNIKKTWNEINIILGHKKQNIIPNEMYSGKNKYSTREQIVEEFNSYFVNVGQRISNSIPSIPESFKRYIRSDCSASLFMKPVSVDELLKICTSLNPSKAYGIDNISPRVVKESIFYFVEPLCYIFNKSISTGVFPESLKEAKVIPLGLYIKKNSKQNIDNYRPVSILPVLSKLLERVMYNRVYDFLAKYDILINEQFGFRKSHSTSHGVLNLSNYVTNELDNGNFCLGIFMDLSKAFDTIDHLILLDKLSCYGVRGVALNWFKSYLMGRKQCVVVDGVKSNFQEMTCGVPQGSVLGPLLFLIYVNDIINSSDILRFSLFADDTVVVLSHKNAHTLISLVNLELRKLISWFQSNKLLLNQDKTKYILFHLRNMRVPPNLDPISIGDSVLQCVQSLSFLGVTIDENLNWKAHIKSVSLKISRSVGYFQKLKILFLTMS